MLRLYQFCCICYDSLVQPKPQAAGVRAVNLQHVDRETLDKALVQLNEYIAENPDLSNLFNESIQSVSVVKNMKNSLLDDKSMFKKMRSLVQIDSNSNNPDVVHQQLSLFVIGMRKLVLDTAQRVSTAIINIAFGIEVSRERVQKRKSIIHSDEEEDGVGAVASDQTNVIHQGTSANHKLAAKHVRVVPDEEFVFDLKIVAPDERSKFMKI